MTDVRLDRAITLYLGGPVSRLLAGKGNVRIPILMYHAVQEGQSDPRPYYEVNVSPSTFEKQMRQLRSAGYRAVSLEQALQALNGCADDQKMVAITFDDGFHDFYETAFPILADCQFTATVFLMTGYMAEPGKCFKGKAVLSWSEVRELHSRGIHFGSHTVSHPQLRTLHLNQVEEEVRASKKVIEDRIGGAVRSFSYPYAFPEVDRQFARQLKDMLAKNGYENGVTTILGTATSRSDSFFLPRLPVNHWDDFRFFQAKLEGAYDWLHSVQFATKLIQRQKR
jgi:peptidoglycan/xylan/chitin deacetylase (PgdA/CDA1 family)